MKEPNPKDYPPQSPHDIEWGGVNSKYWDDTEKWKAQQQNAQIRNYPPKGPDAFPLKEALFPREILQPIYERWRHQYSTNGLGSAEEFYHFLLIQSK